MSDLEIPTRQKPTLDDRIWEIDCAMQDKPGQQMSNGLSRFLASGQFANFEIRCQGHTFKVHKIIIAVRSPVLLKACSSAFKETQQGFMDLPDDDPAYVKAMLDGLYSANYNRVNTVNGVVVDVLSFHASVYAVAEKYDVEAVKLLAIEYFNDELESYFVDTGYNDWEFVDRGDKAIDKIASAIGIVYGTTPSSDRGLRDRILRYACCCAKDLVKYKPFKDLLDGPDECEAFGADLARGLLWDAPKSD